MAIYSLEAKVFSRGQGHSAVAKAAYRAGTIYHDARLGRRWDYSDRTDVEHVEISVPDGAPAWTVDPEQLWNAVEATERRKDSELARECRIALPRELTREQQVILAREWVAAEYASRGMVAQWALHAPEASDGGEQPHIHVMVTTRHLDPDGPSGFSSKKADDFRAYWTGDDAFKKGKKGAFVSSTEGLEGMRQRWAEMCNRHLAAAGVEAAIDHRSLAAQRAEALAEGDAEKAAMLSRPPESKMGKGHGMRKRGLKSDRAEEAQEIREERRKVIDLAEERAKRKPRIHPDDWRAETEIVTPTQQQEMELELEQHKRKFGFHAGTANRGHRPQNDRAHVAPQPAGRGVENRSRATGPGRVAPGAAGPYRLGVRPSDQAADRQERVAHYRSGLDRATAADQAQRQAFKKRLLESWYRTKLSSDLAPALHWVRQRPEETVAQLYSGARVRDSGGALSVQKTDRQAIDLQVQMAKAKDWSDLELSGTTAYKLAAAEAATRAGLVVTNRDLQGIVERVKDQMADEARQTRRYPSEEIFPSSGAAEQTEERQPSRTALPRTQVDDIAFVRQQWVKAVQRAVDAMAIARGAIWRGPDGQDRPFLVRLAGMPAPVPARLSDDEAREVAERRRPALQPAWPTAQSALAEARRRRQELDARWQRLGFFARHGAAGEEIDAERDTLRPRGRQASADLAALEQAWQRDLPQHVAEIREEADRMRDLAAELKEKGAAVAAQADAEAKKLEKLMRELERGAQLGRIMPTSAETDAERLDQLEVQVTNLPAPAEQRGQPELRRRGPGWRSR